MNVDTSQLDKLADDLARAGDKIEKDARAVVFKGAMNVKASWKSNAADASRVGYRLGNAIGFDLEDGGLTAKIEAQGSGAEFGAILEYGTATSPPYNLAKRALDKEDPKFERAMRKIARDVFK